jgi:hypothetical protein
MIKHRHIKLQNRQNSNLTGNIYINDIMVSVVLSDVVMYTNEGNWRDYHHHPITLTLPKIYRLSLFAYKSRLKYYDQNN